MLKLNIMFMKILLKMPGEIGIEGVLERVGRSGVEILMEEELMFLLRQSSVLNGRSIISSASISLSALEKTLL